MSLLSEWVEKNRNNPDHHNAVRNYEMNVELMEKDLSDALADNSVVICQHCGYPETPKRWSDSVNYTKHQACFGCHYWLHHIGVRTPKSNAVIIGGVHHQDGGWRPYENKSFLGFGGHVWYYKKIGEEEVRRTNNMWHQGTIPSWIGVTDNCVLSTKEEWEAQQNGTEKH